MPTQEERVTKLKEAVERLSSEAMRLKGNLERAHKLQRVLAAISEQWVEEANKNTN